MPLTPLARTRLEHSDEVLLAHPPSECITQLSCPLHKRTGHRMRSFPQHWRDDRGIIERICPHGVGHPDPDQLPYLDRVLGTWKADSEMTHGCDGCCRGSLISTEKEE